MTATNRYATPRDGGPARRSRRGWMALTVAAAVLALAATAQVQETQPSADEIVRKADYVSYYQGKDGRAKVKMTVVDAQGTERTKQMVILRWDAQDAKAADAKTDAFKQADAAFTGEQKFYVYFTAPPDDNKTTFLVHKHLDKDDDRWLYLPNLDLVKRIAATDKRTSFVGSHFFYEDVSGRNVDADKHELLKVTDDYYVLRNTPKDPATVEFAYYDVYILKSNFLPVYAHYFDADGKQYRTMSVLKWDVDKTYGYPIVQQAKMEDAKLGGHTILEYDAITFNIGLPEDLFTERFLKRTPFQYLQ